MAVPPTRRIYSTGSACGLTWITHGIYTGMNGNIPDTDHLPPHIVEMTERKGFRKKKSVLPQGKDMKLEKKIWAAERR